ncbi:ATP-binding protein [Butyricimonas synergistica]|uniref:ATP-binding protein n=1 Tax=Butyricimonas synergistica TaxID=544644 RepID=UPI0022E8A40A|nr:ATP-binding protein [Butyricimonas synergistica]
MEENQKINAEVISVYPNKVKISVDDLNDFQLADEKLKVGAYLRIADSENAILIAIIENFSIEVTTDKDGNATRKYILEANPLGLIRDGKFERGGDTIAIPPKKVEPAKKEEIEKIYSESLHDDKKFSFARLSANTNIIVPVDGDKFFNKHIAVIGSTGSGKSHTVAKIIQQAIKEKKDGYTGLNNSHIIIFDIHSEYKSAFPQANFIDINTLILPYWLLNSDELQELFIDTEANDHNQRNVFKEAVISSRKKYFKGDEKIKDKIHFDSPLFFDLNDVLEDAKNKNQEIIQTGDTYSSGDKKGQPKTIQGGLFGKLSNFVSRLENKINDKRLDFLLGEKSKNISFEDTLKQLISYGNNTSNVTILDLSGIPFEVLSITVSLISRILFEYGYFYKRVRAIKKYDEIINNDIPILLVYEEAHKYVPNSDLYKYRASKQSIERIAKEGRKYGVSLLLASQRPSEISETIFSQCNNFIAMRLTNPNDQNYVKKLLPDTLGGIVDKMPTLKAGECLLIGDSVILPSIVQIDKCLPAPSSNDIPYFQLWKEQWKTLCINEIKEEWYK